MIFVKQIATDRETGIQYIVIQLHTSCCKEILIFRKLEDGTYYSVTKQETAGEVWKQQIEKALKIYDDLPKP